MKSPPAASACHQRKIHYVDAALQKWLLVALVMLETGLVGASVWLLRRHLNAVIEDNLYRMHVAAAAPMMTQLMHEAFLVLGLFVIVNVIALLVAHGIWHRYVYSVLRDFMALVGKTARLDFSPDPDSDRRHEVLALAGTWRARERARLAAIREHLTRLDAGVSGGSPPQSVRNTLDGLNELLSVAPPGIGRGQAGP